MCLSMEVHNIGPDYPSEPPLIAFKSEQLSSNIVRSLTLHTAIESVKSTGSPMVHALMTSVCEYLSTLDIHQPSFEDERSAEPKDTLKNTTSKMPGSKEIAWSNSHQPDQLSKGVDWFIKAHHSNRKALFLFVWCFSGVKKVGLSAEDAKMENKRLKRQLEQFASSSEMLEMRSTRHKLPAWSQRESVVDTINRNQVVIITGMPGCGKSTQVQRSEQKLASGVLIQQLNLFMGSLLDLCL